MPIFTFQNLVSLNFSLSLSHPSHKCEFQSCFSISSDDKYILVEIIPKTNLDYDAYLRKVRANGYELKKVPNKYKDYSLCLTAVKQNGQAIKFVPRKFRKKELCIAAIKQDGFLIKYIPKEFKSKDMYLKSVSRINRRLRKYIPIEYKEKIAR